MNETISGSIIPGDGEGRTIGFRTANLDTAAEQILVEHGIYAGYVTLAGSTEHLPAAIIVRSRDNKKAIEVHILDFDESIYNTRVITTIKEMVRPWKSFEDIEELKKQIEDDLFNIRNILNV